MTPLAIPDRIAVDAHGYGWRVWDDEECWSMVPTNPDNSPIPWPITWFEKVTIDPRRVLSVLGDLIDALHDELRYEVNQTPVVLEQIRCALPLLGDDYAGYKEWMLTTTPATRSGC